MLTPVPDFELITLADAKAQLRLDAAFDYEDDLILGYRDAAIAAAEDYIGKTITNETFAVHGKTFNTVCVEDWRKVTFTQVQALLEGEEDYTTLSADQYSFVRIGLSKYKIVPAAPLVLQDVADAVKLEGLCAVSTVVRQACLLIMADFYTYRENRTDIGNDVAKRLLFPHRG